MAFSLNPLPAAVDFRALRALAARRWWVALAVSLLVHALLLSSPGWQLPTLDELLQPQEQLEARLLPPPLPASLPAPSVPPSPPAAVAEAAQPPRPAAPRRPSATRAPAPVAAPAGVAEAPAETATQAPAQAAAPPPQLAPTAPAASSALPRRARLRFGIAMGGRGFVVGRAEHHWMLEGARYTLRATAETTGLAALFKPAVVTQVSEGEVLAEGLRPRAFRVERGGTAGDAASFDWAGGRVAMTPGPRDSPVEPGMQDMLSLFWQLGLLPVSPTGMAVTVATGKKIERYVFALSGEENIETALGERRAIHLKTIGTSGGDATEIWIDADKRLPLRIRHVDRKGEVFDQTVEEMEIE